MAKENALRADDIAKGMYVPVSTLPKKDPKKASQNEAALPMTANH